MARIVPGANRSVRATLISLVLPSVTTANFFRPPWLRTSSWHLLSVCSKTVWYNSHGRFSFSIGQRRSVGRDRYPQMFQLPLTARQTAANLAQRMRPSHLAKQQGHELAPTRETPRVPLGLVLLDRLLEIPARKQLQHLRENAAYFVHRLSLLPLNWFLSGTQSTVSGAQPLNGSVCYAFRRPVISLIWTAVILTTRALANQFKRLVAASGTKSCSSRARLYDRQGVPQVRKN